MGKVNPACDFDQVYDIPGTPEIFVQPGFHGFHGLATELVFGVFKGLFNDVLNLLVGFGFVLQYE